MLGDDEAIGGAKGGIGGSGGPRAFQENDFCKKKVVSCIKFHPTKPHLVAMSMLEELAFEERADKTKTSYDAFVLIVNFSDVHIITLNYVLETPIEISAIDWHPTNPYLIYGGMISGQVTVWDLAH